MKVYVAMGDAGYGDGLYAAAVFKSEEMLVAKGYGTYDIEEFDLYDHWDSFGKPCNCTEVVHG